MPTKLFVGCLPLKPEVTTDELSNYFGPYGKLDDVYIPKPYRYLHVCTLYTLWPSEHKNVSGPLISTLDKKCI